MNPEELLAKVMTSGVVRLEEQVLTDSDGRKELQLTEEEAEYLRSLRAQD